MAERRSVYKKISISEKIHGLSPWAQLLFTWSIAHADDLGLLPRSCVQLKGLVFPLKEKITSKEVEKMIIEIVKAKLYVEFEHEDKKFIFIRNFKEHQTLKKDRNPTTILKYPLKSKAYKDNWANGEELIDQLVSNWNPVGSGREGKGREGKGKNKEVKKTAIPTKSDIEHFIKFFIKSTKVLRNFEPSVDLAKDSDLIFLRLKQLGNDNTKLEKMSIWYLTRKKKKSAKTKEGLDWYEEFKNSPTIATMLSNSHYNVLLNDAVNDKNFLKENMSHLEKIYQKSSIESVESVRNRLINKFKIN